MVIRLKLTLEQDEYSALLESALADLRNPSDQARFILRQELEKRGLLISKKSSSSHVIASEAKQSVIASALREAISPELNQLANR
jgi:hypothetical protein